MVSPEKNVPQHIVIKLTKIKDKERVLKSIRGKQQITYRGTPIRLSADFSTANKFCRTEGSGEIYLRKKKKDKTNKNQLTK